MSVDHTSDARLISTHEPIDLRDYDKVKLELADIVRFAAAKAPRDGGLLPREFVDFFARLAEDRFNLVLAGRFSRGKTSLMNAILGTDRLPTGIVPLTSVITSVSYGSTEHVQLELERGGVPLEIGMGELPDYITERGNPGNRQRIREARIKLPAEILRRGFYFVDTPGLGSAITENTQTALRFLPEADAVVLVSGYDSPLSEEELDVLRGAARSATQVFLVLNKQDTVEPGARPEVVAFVSQRLSTIFGSTPPRIFSTSAIAGMAAKLGQDHEQLRATGVSELEEALTRFLVEHKRSRFLHRIIERAAGLLESVPADGEVRALLDRVDRIRSAHGRASIDPPGSEEAAIATMAQAAGSQVQRCQLCEQITQAFFEFLCRFQHAVVTEPGELERFVVNGGFCARHFWLYRAIAAPRDICVALAPLLMNLSAQLRAAAVDAATATHPTPARCHMCRMQEQIETRTLADIVIKNSAAGSMRSTVPALCMPHLRIISSGLEDPALSASLFTEHARALDRLAEDLRRYALKHDALRRYLTSEEERRAAEDAVLLIAGRRLITQ